MLSSDERDICDEPIPYPRSPTGCLKDPLFQNEF